MPRPTLLLALLGTATLLQAHPPHTYAPTNTLQQSVFEKDPSLPHVTTPFGDVVGTTEANGLVERFTGIPFAQPPLGPLRFAAARPWTARYTNGTLNATAFAPPCIQNPLGDPSETPDPEAPPPSEDCLFLNVWRPSKPATKPRAVMVWIFGGGLCAGATSDRWYNGSMLALDNDVVLVSISFRLGALGFLVTDDPLTVGNGGMNGFGDMVVALQFIQDHIQLFGGDPTRVTIFGQSSGGYSVCTLVTSPAAHGLFSRAIIQSGPCVGGWGPQNATYGRTVTQHVLRTLNATSIDDLRRLDANLIQWPDDVMNDPAIAPYFSGYFFDEGGIVSQMPWQSFQNGQLNVRPQDLIIGFTSKDGTAAYYGTAPTLPHTSPSDYTAALQSAWGSRASAVQAEYPLSEYHNSPQSAFIQADADSFVICPLLRVAREISTAKHGPNEIGAPFVYEYAHWNSHSCDISTTLNVTTGGASTSITSAWASHGAEYTRVFETVVGPNSITYAKQECPFSASEVSLSKLMSSSWANFAICGNPNGCTGGEMGSSSSLWPPFCDNSGCGNVLRFGVEEVDGFATHIVENPHAAQCSFWDDS